MDDNYVFGNKIYELRKKKGFTQEDIALELGISDKAVSKWENGTSKPTINNLRKLSNMLDISLEELLHVDKKKELTEISKIVITGGPCAGKTTALKKIREHFESIGYKVIIIPSMGTEIIRSGFSPSDFKEHLDFEEGLMKTQIYLEELAEEQVSKIKYNKILLICERGTMDALPYSGSKEFNKVLLDLNLTKEELMNAYDAVFHLTTVAKHYPEEYENDGLLRIATVDEAISIDNKILDAWADHPNVRVINSYKYINDKIDRLIKEITYFLKGTSNNYYEKKLLIEIPEEEELRAMSGYSKANLSTTYLNTKEDIKIIKRKVNNSSCYYRVIKSSNGRVSTRISPKKYIDELDNQDPNTMRLDKIRYSFIYKNNNIKIDIFPSIKDKAILEVDLLNSREVLELPKFIKVLEDVSNNPKYKNKNLASNRKN